MIPIKNCKHCEGEFTPSKDDVRIKFCSDKCRIEHRRVTNYMKKYYSENVDKWNQRQKTEKYKEDKNAARRLKYKEDEEYRERQKAKAIEYNQKNPHVKKNNHLVVGYGITLDEYHRILKKQNGKCAICGSEDSGSKKADFFFVDHDHDTGNVRGLLCCNCNFGIGHFNDNIKELKNAIKYLEEFKNGKDGKVGNMV